MISQLGEPMHPENLSPVALRDRRDNGELWQLLDVRETWEVELANVVGAVHIPMAEVPHRHQELKRDRPLAVLCHSGVRSARVAAYLLEIGFNTVANIAGGIDAWSQEVDSSVPRY